jgi:hypothetical protein
VIAADVRIPHARLLIVIAAVIVGAVILWLSLGFTFYFDEWTFILSTNASWTYYLQPHNEHPAMLPKLIYAVLLNTVGLRSYVPYMAVLIALHGMSVVLLFDLVRRRAGDLVAIGAALLLLVIGAGWENLLWAFQIGFVGSVACGLGALLAMDALPQRMWVSALLLLASLMFSGIGLFFLVAAAMWLVLTPTRRGDLVWLAPVAVVLGVWYIAYGHAGGAPVQQQASLADRLAALPVYVAWGLGASVAGLVGEGGAFGPVLLFLAIGVIAYTWRLHPPDPFAIAIAVALIAFYVVLGFNRAQIGYQQSGSGRYVYEGATFWLLLLADAARHLAWRGTWRPALAACLFLACFSSSVLLYTWVAAKSEQMLREAADLHALAAVRGDPCLNPNGAVDLLVMPPVTSPAAYYHAVDRYGDPAAGLPANSGPAFEHARANLLTPGCA